MSRFAKLPNPIKWLTLLIGSGAITDFGLGFWLILAPSTSSTSSTNPLPPWYVLFSGLLCLVMGLVYIWIIGQTISRAPSTQILIQVVSVINISFSIFRLPFGLLAILLNAIAFAIASSSGAKSWFTPSF